MFLSNLKLKSIKLKFLIQYGIIIVFSLMITCAMIYSLLKISTLSEEKSISQEVALQVFKLRKYEKDFIINDLSDKKTFENGVSSNTQNFEIEYQRLVQNLNVLMNQSEKLNENLKDSLLVLKTEIETYKLNFDTYKKYVFQKGFKDWGLEGKLRESIHKIEKGNLDYDKVLMLTLRRCEKDFFLRKDPEYIDKFDKSLSEFKKSVRGNAVLYSLANNYYTDFHRVVNIEKLIGLTPNEGLKFKISNAFEKAESSSKFVNAQLIEQANLLIQNTYIRLVFLVVLQLIIAIVLAITFSNKTANAVKIIDERITKLSEGVFPDQIDVIGKDEFAHTSDSFNNLLARIKVASAFAQKIGEGELAIQYDERYSNDVLGSSLKTMHQKLIDVSKENEQRNWVNEGLAKFVDLMRNTDDIELFYNTILSNIIRYIDANQGYLYVLNDNNQDDPFMEIKGVYAYGKQRYLEEKNNIKFQQGLIGQAWFDKETLFFTEIPSDYVNITSGMGEATPRCISIIPLISNENVIGILEIASFEVLENFKIEFIEKLGESIANTIASVKINANTLHLLQQSQLLTADLREQEEEIRQNMEEMNATQEEMERKERELMRRMRILEDEINIYKQKEEVI
jgi:hypothetical protein